ncbi:MAG: Biopolymer transport protein ExbD [Verrucomicrobia subdivision 3 bacterium]|nr:Biopolymer transport protein ExbD [Limisphaerales bacterium]MCS1414734.1 Biopolymer transport protein ExbD [Limisphaerales bacterium]
MKYRRSINESEEISEINVSPLIDMVFILLIFFIVTTVFVEETGIEVDKPQAASAVSLEKNSILLAVTGKGQVVYGGREVGVAGVRPLVKRMTQAEDMPVIVQGDENANYGIVLQVVDEAKLGGAISVSLASERSGG